MSFLSLTSKLLSVCIQNNAIGFKRNIFWYREPVPEPFIVMRARKEDFCDVIDLLWKSYYPDEPTLMALRLGYMYQPIFDELAYSYLEYGLSYLAKCSFTYEIVGGCINKVCSPWEPGETDKFACKLPSPELRNLYQFRAFVQRSPCLWENYCTDKIFELKNIFVRRQDRRRGVAKLLVEASRKLGADCGHKVIRCDATNMYIDFFDRNVLIIRDGDVGEKASSLLYRDTQYSLGWHLSSDISCPVSADFFKTNN